MTHITGNCDGRHQAMDPMLPPVMDQGDDTPAPWLIGALSLISSSEPLIVVPELSVVNIPSEDMPPAERNSA